MSKSFLPDREADLVTFSNTFATVLASLTTAVGVTSAQSDDFTALNAAWVAAYNVANTPETRSPTNIILKNNAKRAMIANARMLSGIIQKYPATTDDQRAELGITVPKPGPTPVPPPEDGPTIEVVSSNNHTVKIRLKDAGAIRRGKPAGASIAYVYSFLGAAAPSDITQWTFQGTTSKAEVKVTFPPDTASGAQVWFVACWLNPRQQPGPLGPPVTTTIAGGVSSAEQTMKIAA